MDIFWLRVAPIHALAELVWKVGRYTSAAPFYFTEFENYIDGGMLANNPSEAALTVIQDFYHKRGEKIPIALLVSVGSGVNPGSPLGEIDIKKNLLKPRAYLNLMEVLESAVRDCRDSAYRVKFLMGGSLKSCMGGAHSECEDFAKRDILDPNHSTFEFW